MPVLFVGRLLGKELSSVPALVEDNWLRPLVYSVFAAISLPSPLSADSCWFIVLTGLRSGLYYWALSRSC